MLKTFNIEGYRGFNRFEMRNLGQINLLVGTNNSGKTSILEALYLLARAGDPFALASIISKRGEISDSTEDELEIFHLFNGHDPQVGAHFSFSATGMSPAKSVKFSLEERPPEKLPLFPNTDGDLYPRLVLNISGTNNKPSSSAAQILLNRNGCFVTEYLEYTRRRRPSYNFRSIPAQYVSTESLAVSTLKALWDQVVLTDEELTVLEALKFIDPKIERIAAISTKNSFRANFSRGGFKVKIRDSLTPIPIGSLGDGTWRILALAIALIKSKDGLLLVDEIDTGLHYSVMANMWRLVSSVAKANNIQVFATSHSHDCVQSLAMLCKEDSNNGDISIQRIESNRSFSFSESQIKMAADRDIEVR
ncbi:AAA family ATPase [Rhodomicrobium lacus]|uniref:AAA family ATPase n=1 Tax=Rhodomicrobium lacus TaxID=2498452 RepID=UPI0026E46907|nr:ATP-binding protein [Rhodomicrobium lacus]WKW51890.1 ATP-binding protein [Rhodomicrobium lacus]